MGTKAKSTGYRKLLGLTRRGGEWCAVVQGFAVTPREPVLAEIYPVAELKGSQRRKASRWLVDIGAPAIM